MPYRVYGNIECFGRRRERLLPRPRMRPAPVVYVAAYHGTLRRRLVQKPRIQHELNPVVVFFAEIRRHVDAKIISEYPGHNLRI
jgi:hypothetical protein